MSKKEFNLYDFRRELLTKKRELRKKILGEDSAHQRFMTELTKTKRAIKIELGLSKSKASGTDEKDTSIELFVEQILKENNIKYTKQKRVRYLNYDFYLDDFNILIECQGSYWHVDSREYPEGPKNEIQRKNLVKNENKRQFAKEANIELLEIQEYDIKKDPENVKKRLLAKCGL